jgi:inorganic pyrophosphatase
MNRLNFSRWGLFFSLIISVFLWVSCGNSTNNKVSSAPKEVKEYFISCDTNELSKIYTNYRENTYIPIKITFKGETVAARMRIRGDTSREDPKKSLKIKFDSLFVDGLPKVINLNAEYADKTYIRQYASSLLMNKSGQACYKSEHIKVFINDQFYGLYLQVENMDADFLKRNDLDKKGNLYKATKDGACLSIFDDFNVKWEKKTNKKSDHNDLTNLINDINNTPNDEFEAFIKKTFEYEKLVNILALNMFLSNNSTYYHNYYLYHDLYNTGKWQMLPWDMDKTLSYYNWMPYTYHRTSSEWESDNPLVERAILCKPIFNDIKKRVDELHNSHLNNDAFAPILKNITQLLEEIIPLDSTDKINDVKEWKKYLKNEEKYFNNHYKLLQKQFNNQPQSFYVHRFKQLQTGRVTFNWNKAKHPNNKAISYVLTYGTDFLLKDSTKTKYITNITDTFYTISKLLPEDTYYWKVTAFDGEHYTDGFNTKNIFKVVKGTPLPSNISGNLTLTFENSPYIAETKTLIKEGVTLTIEPGVEIHLPHAATIDCNGNFIANGTAEKPITFMPQNGVVEWDYIYFQDPCKKAYLKNVTLYEGTINCKAEELTIDSCNVIVDKKDVGQSGGSRKVLLYTNKGKILIKNSTFKSNGFGEGMVLFYGDITTENCFYDNVPDAIEYISLNKGVIRNNYVINSPDDAIDLNNCNNVLIEGNFLFNNIDKAISIGTEQYGASLKNIIIKNNLIVKNKTGIAIKDSSVAHTSNNTLFKNKNAIYAYKKREDYKVGGFGFIKNSIFEKNEKLNVYSDEYSKLTTSNSSVTNKVLDGKNNFKADPKFIAAGGNNFHLRKNSPCRNKGDDGQDIGAFGFNQTTISLAKIHVKSSKKENIGDYIKIINNYNMPVDLSLYKILIIQEGKEKTYVFPIGTKLPRMGNLFISNKFLAFIKFYPKTYAIGGLPKLNEEKTTIKLLNAGGYVLDEYSYKTVEKKAKNITFRSNEINDKTLKKWQLITN